VSTYTAHVLMVSVFEVCSSDNEGLVSRLRVSLDSILLFSGKQIRARVCVWVLLRFRGKSDSKKKQTKKNVDGVRTAGRQPALTFCCLFFSRWPEVAK
jgi:hypothetical protein